MKIIYIIIVFIISSIQISLFSQPQYWNEQTSGVTVQLTSVSPLGNEAWVCGYSGTVLRTTNAGTNWINVSGGGIPNTVSLINIWGFDANTALVAGYLGTDTWVWRTSNAGVNWVQVFSQPNGFINGMVFRRTLPNTGFLQGDPVGGRWSLWKTTNGGINWDSTGRFLPQAGTEAGWNNSVYVSSMGAYSFSGLDTLLWFGTNNSRIYFSSNFGQNWAVQSTSPEVNSYAIGFHVAFPALDGLTGGTALMRTSNGGLNWVTQTAPGTGNFGGFVLFPIPVATDLISGYNWIVRNDANIYREFMGQGWLIDYTAPAGNYRHMAVARNTSTIWAVRSNGGITKCNCFVSEIEPTTTAIPDSYALLQNYPNPFNPETHFGFRIPVFGLVKLTIYDALGKEVVTLVNKELQPGSYAAEWDASVYPSGVYYYKLESGSYAETRKMVLIK
ncbi:MAG: T9SS type A sorting domain-containing protein [Ignavibacteria bacterium]